jgi:hypothetical protein
MSDPLDLLPRMLAEVPELDDAAFERLATVLHEQIVTSAQTARSRRVSTFRRPARHPVVPRRAAAIAFVALVITAGVVVVTSTGRGGPAGPNPSPWPAYVVALRTLANSRQVSVLIPFDPTSDRVGSSITLPAQGTVAIAPGGREALVLTADNDLAYPVDLHDGAIGRPISVGPGPDSVAFAPDGTVAYIADAGSDACAIACFPDHGREKPGDEVTPVNLLTNKPERPIRTCQGPMQLAMSPTGSTLLVACNFGGIDVVATGTKRVIAHYDVPGSPGNVAFANDGRTVIVGQIFVADLQTVLSWIVLINSDTGQVSKPVVVGKPGGTSVAALTPGGIAYINTWGRPIPPSEAAQPGATGEYTTEIVPFDLQSRRVGQPVAVPTADQPVAAVAYWPGFGVRYVTSPDPSGNIVEYQPGRGSRLIRTGSPNNPGPASFNFSGIVALDPNTPLAIMSVGSSGNTAREGVQALKIVNLATGAVSPAIRLPSSVSSVSVEFDGGPMLNVETPT